MKHILLLLLISHACASVASSQQNREEEIPLKKLHYSVGLGFQLGPIDRFEASPAIAYRIFPRWSVALGPRYLYYRNKALNLNIKSHAYGGSFYSDLVLVKTFEKLKPLNFPGSLFLRGELEMLNLNVNDFDPGNHLGQTRFWKPGYLLGGGLKQVTKTGSGLFIVVMYNFNDSKRLPYDNPAVKFGFVF